MMSPEVNHYLADVPAPHRAALEELRRIIRSTVPEAQEWIRVGVPAFKVRGRPLASIGSARNHIALYLMYSTVIDDHADILAGYDVSKTVVRFKPQGLIPEAVVVRLLQARLAELGFPDALRTPSALHAVAAAHR